MSGIIQVNPNRQPIYPVEPLQWEANLIAQVTGKNPSDQSVNPTLITPVKMGIASKSGAIIYGVTVTSNVPPQTPPSGGGTSPGGAGGGSAYNGPFGIGIVGDPVRIYFFSKKFGDTRFYYKGQLPLNPEVDQQTYRFSYPVSPIHNGWGLPPEMEVYCSLSKVASYPGLNIFLDGGHYSPTT